MQDQPLPDFLEDSIIDPDWLEAYTDEMNSLVDHEAEDRKLCLLLNGPHEHDKLCNKTKTEEKAFCQECEDFIVHLHTKEQT